MMISIIDYFINRRSLEDGNALLGRDWIFIFHYYNFFFFPCTFSLPSCSLKMSVSSYMLCISAGGTCSPSKWSFNGTVCTGAGNSMGRCHCRWELLLNQSVKPHHLPQQMIQKNPFGEAKWAFYVPPSKTRGRARACAHTRAAASQVRGVCFSESPDVDLSSEKRFASFIFIGIILE